MLHQVIPGPKFPIAPKEGAGGRIQTNFRPVVSIKKKGFIGGSNKNQPPLDPMEELQKKIIKQRNRCKETIN